MLLRGLIATKRRTFVFSLYASALYCIFKLLGIGLNRKFTSESNFVSSYEIELSHFPNLKELKPHQLSNFSFAKALFPDLDESWYQKYNQTKKQFFLEKRLLASERYLSADGTKIVFTNKWKSEKDFFTFIKSANLMQIHHKFLSANCKPSFKVV